MTAKRGLQLQVSCIEFENVLIFFFIYLLLFTQTLSQNHLTIIIRLTHEDKKKPPYAELNSRAW